MSLADRFRAIVRPPHDGGPRGPRLRPTGSSGPAFDCPGGAPSGASRDPAAVADILGGEYREWHGHPYLVIDRKYPPGHRHGGSSVADHAPGHDGCWPALSVLEPRFAGRRQLLFIDLETTGLAGGAGTYAFLIGCGWFDGATFRTRQFLLAGFGAERGVLEQLAETAAGADSVASYNGKAFDLPLIETRFVLHRMATPFEDMPHIDMLHPVRRLWRFDGRRGSGTAEAGRGSGSAGEYASGHPARSCRLAAVERAVLGHVREADVPGFEIPLRYFDYVRSGDARPLEAVLEHNRLDVLSLAMLTAHAARLLEQGAAGAATPQEALGLGRLYQRGNLIAEARACFARAAGLDAETDLNVGPCTEDRHTEDRYTEDLDHTNELTRAEALRAYAVLCRRERQYEHAAEGWRRLLALRTCAPHLTQEAIEALAVHHEHRLRDLRKARELALQALEFSATSARRQAVHHRVARLDCKLAAATEPRGHARVQRRRKYVQALPTANPAPLF